MGVRVPTGGGPLLRYFGNGVMKKGLKQSLRRGDSCFYIHPLDISDEPLPKVVIKERGLFWWNRGPNTLAGFTNILDEFAGSFCTLSEIYQRKVRGDK